MTTRSWASVLAFLTALVLSALHAHNAAQFIAHSSGRTGLLPHLFLPVVLCSVLSLIYGLVMTSPSAIEQRRWATIGSLCAVIPVAALFGFLTLFAVLGTATDTHPAGSVVSASSPAIAAATVLVYTTALGPQMPCWARCSGLVVISAVPVLLAIARVLLVP
ncbi:hypothetical protein DEJ06_00525 [Curtobacterium sp. MCLR17_051]|nr:hypothetical protein DEJ07_05670 [Curtobacterium sp. MCLR17_053]PZF54282.1 hypothetical protein DEJ06_00525 [Curtobacterium sp. MCLR17_051]